MRKLSPILFGLFVAFNAHAAHRTFVAASGTDTGTCGPTAQCRTLDYAMSQTDSGGEVIITESGGYGSSPSGGITITKSISIIAQPGIVAALAPTTGYDGIAIATASIKVGLKDLTINNRGGDSGISVTNNATVSVENCSISGFSTNAGILVDSSLAKIRMANTVVKNSYYGLRVKQGRTAVTGSKFIDNNYGIGAAPTSNSSVAIVTIADSFITGSTEGMIVYTGSTTGSSAIVYASNIDVHDNGWGIDLGNGGTVIIGGSSFMNNASGHFYQGGTGVFKSANNNLLDNNSAVSGTITNSSATMFK